MEHGKTRENPTAGLIIYHDLSLTSTQRHPIQHPPQNAPAEFLWQLRKTESNYHPPLIFRPVPLLPE